MKVHSHFRHETNGYGEIVILQAAPGASDNSGECSFDLNGFGKPLADKLLSALVLLLEAYHYATDTNEDLWNFAVPVQRIIEIGLNETDLRWLILKGYCEHQREVTIPGNNGREFRPTGNLTFSRRTCFILSSSGVMVAQSIRETILAKDSNGVPPTLTVVDAPKTRMDKNVIPVWDQDSRRLSVSGVVVKEFKWRASNQEAILCAFQEERWPGRIDDPLPPQPEQDSKRRLADTIKCLNRKQSNRLIRFRGDGTGEGIMWEAVRLALRPLPVGASNACR